VKLAIQNVLKLGDTYLIACDCDPTDAIRKCKREKGIGIEKDKSVLTGLK
jgi:hypothetical protein